MLFWGEETSTVVSVKMRKLNWNIIFKFLAKNRGKRSINCDPKLSLCNERSRSICVGVSECGYFCENSNLGSQGFTYQ